MGDGTLFDEIWEDIKPVIEKENPPKKEDSPKEEKPKVTPETLTKGNKAVKEDRKRVSKQKWEQDYQKKKKKGKK